MKTVADYLNDPRLTGDPQMAEALETVKEIHAARLMLMDETEGMTSEERLEFYRKKTEAVFTDLGLPLPQYVNLEEQGKIRYNEPVRV